MVLGGSVVEEKKATVVGWFAQEKKNDSGKEEEI